MLLALTAAITNHSCKKFLDEKPNKKLAVPTTLKDARAILENNSVMLVGETADEISADNYYLTDADYNSLEETGQQRMYTWEPDHHYDNFLNDWFTAYQKVYSCNLVLNCLAKITPTAADQNEWNILKGQALMIRAKVFFTIANIWAPAYEATTAAQTLGIPLRVKEDFTLTSTRASLQETFEKIVTDLKMSLPLLPTVGVNAAYPTRVSSYAYLSRVLLSMHRYAEAGLYADSCLQLNSSLIDYNTLSATTAAPFAPFHAEQLYYCISWAPQLAVGRAIVDSTLYPQYETEDLRRLIYFKVNANGTQAYKGGYDGLAGSFFSGIATDEIYLTRAECYARAGDNSRALADINALLRKRYRTGSFLPVTISDNEALLEFILKERRKELVMRFVRWMDIKRLNKEGANISLQRKINNQTYTLAPNDLRFALPIPEEIIRLTGMPQNPR